MSAPPIVRPRRTLRASLVGLALSLVAGFVVLLGTAPANAEEEAPVTTPQVATDNVTSESFRVTATLGEQSGPADHITYELFGGDGVITRNVGESVTYDGLTPDTTYQVEVVAYGFDGSSASNSFYVSTLPLPPTQPQVNVSDITWDTASVSVAPGQNSSPVNALTVVVTGTDYERESITNGARTFTFEALTPDSDYTVTVTATGPGGTSSATTSFRTLQEPPATPFIMMTGAIQPDSALLSIALGEGGGPVDGFIVNLYRGAVLEQFKNVPTDTTSVLFEGLTPSTDYVAELIAVGAGGTASSTGGFYTSAAPVDPEEPTEPTPTPEPTTTTEPTPQPTGTLPETDGDASTVPPAESSLTDGTRGSVTAPEETAPGSSVVVTVGGSYAGQSVNGWLFSTPTSLGSATVSAEGTVTFTIPSSVPAGAHRLALTASDGSLIGWDNITVAKASATTETLAETGGEILPPLAVAMALLLAGASLMLVRVLRGNRHLRRETFVKQE